ncbi:MAG TPA: hypothetical protein VM580_01325 [Labilithrix sp.]|nr:hypothetical protein [Labilithrix sp.]
MSIDIFRERGTPLEKQEFDWKDLVQIPYSKLDDDAFTRVRVILMNGIEADALRAKHVWARMNKELRLPLARIRRVEHHQQTMVNWLNPPDQNVLETTLGFEQVAVELTATLARHEPDPYLKSVLEFGLLEDFDHLYRYAALADRVEGMDANNITQCYTDIMPGRPTSVEHRAPDDDVRENYDRKKADPISKINTVIITAAEYQTHDYYMTVGPTYADPVGRQLYAEIASIEEQHVTQYESLADPNETILEKWLLHEVSEAYAYYSCARQESNPRIRAIWERFVDYELGHAHAVMELMKQIEKRDPAEIVPSTLPTPLDFSSHRKYLRELVEQQVSLRANGTKIVPLDQDSKASIAYRGRMNRAGSPSEEIAAGYRWRAGGELTKRTNGHARVQEVTP